MRREVRWSATEVQKTPELGAEKKDPSTSRGASGGGFSHHDFNVPSQPVHALEHLRLANAPELAAQHGGNLGLGNAKYLRSLRLGKAALLDDLANLCGEDGLELHLGSIWQPQVL